MSSPSPSAIHPTIYPPLLSFLHSLIFFSDQALLPLHSFLCLVRPMNHYYVFCFSYCLNGQTPFWLNCFSYCCCLSCFLSFLPFFYPTSSLSPSSLCLLYDSFCLFVFFFINLPMHACSRMILGTNHNQRRKVKHR